MYTYKRNKFIYSVGILTVWNIKAYLCIVVFHILKSRQTSIRDCIQLGNKVYLIVITIARWVKSQGQSVHLSLFYKMLLKVIIAQGVRITRHSECRERT